MPSTKNIIWIVITDSNACRLYHYQNHATPHQLTLIKEINHPENKLRDIDLTSDKPGRYQADDGSSHGAFSQRADPKEIKIANFAQEIANELDHDRTLNAYTQLVVVASPHMNGLLLQNMNKHVKNMIVKTIVKDVLHLSEPALFNCLKDELMKPNC